MGKIVRYLALIIGIVMLSINGCHNATGPTSPDTATSILKGEIQISIKNVVFSFRHGFGTHYLETGKTDYNEASGRSIESFDFNEIVGSNSFFVKGTQTITALSVGEDTSQSDSHFFAAFSNLSYTTLTNDTLFVDLHGVGSASHLINIVQNDSMTGPVSGTIQQGHYQSFYSDEYDYFQCTDSTEVKIKIHL